MKYDNIVRGRFIERINRFVATVNIYGEVARVHVKNTGRLKELLKPGASVYLQRSDSPGRSTEYDLVSVEAFRDGKTLLFNIDSAAPNLLALEWLRESGLFSEKAIYMREVTVGTSRLDIAVNDDDRITYVEVKGVTLDVDGIAYFPDAPTARGTKHILELSHLAENGSGALLLFVLQMKRSAVLVPNRSADPEFSRALTDAVKKGVRVIAIDCNVTPDSITPDKEVPVEI